MTKQFLDKITTLAQSVTQFGNNAVSRYISEQTSAALTARAIRRSGPWSGDNQLGYATPIRLLQNLNVTNTGGTSQALSVNENSLDFKLDECEFPQVWSLALGIQGPENVAEAAEQSLVYDFIAKVTFGCGGASQTVEFNIQNGAVISGPANSITVHVEPDGPISSIESIPANTYQIVYTVSRNAAGNPPVQRIKQLTADANTRSPLIKIPPFGRFVSLMGTDEDSVTQLASASNYLVFADGVSVQGMVPGNQLVESKKVPIPGGSRYIYFLNASAEVVTLKAFFDICF